MTRKKLIAANWKMHKTVAEAAAFAAEFVPMLESIPGCDLVVFPPATALATLSRAFKATRVAVGAQNVHWEASGAFTGEVSVEMIADAGGTWTIVGHSERRHLFGETDEAVARKLGAALAGGLSPILCVGEKLESRQAGEAESVVRRQLDAAFAPRSAGDLSRVVVAYEPVWAIGTGQTATPGDAETMHRFIRRTVEARFGAEAASTLRILYGGSVKPDNAAGLLGRPGVDGALVGGASLEAGSFADIARATG